MEAAWVWVVAVGQENEAGEFVEAQPFRVYETREMAQKFADAMSSADPEAVWWVERQAVRTELWEDDDERELFDDEASPR